MIDLGRGNPDVPPPAHVAERLAAAALSRDAAVHGYAPFSGLPALKEYGMIVADNGSNWYLSGAPHAKWSNDQLHTLHRVPGSAFEVVDGTKLKP